MRLIDADKLLRPGYTDFFDEPITFETVTKEAIDRAPTVEAIPVEWLKNWFEYQQWMGSYMSDEISCTASDIIDAWHEEQNRKRWEEEHETN